MGSLGGAGDGTSATNFFEFKPRPLHNFGVGVQFPVLTINIKKEGTHSLFLAVHHFRPLPLPPHRRRVPYIIAKWFVLYSKVCFFTCSHACRPLSGEITQKPAPNPHARSPSFWRCRRSWKDASRLRDATSRATHASQVRRFRELQETAKIFAHAKIQRMTEVFAAHAKIK